MIPTHQADSVKEVISRSIEYMKEIGADPRYDSVRNDCRNTNENCSHWALGSGCDDNPNYMMMHCSPACRSCDHVLAMKESCALDPNGKDALEKGGMDALFEGMVRVAVDSGWRPEVLSRPRREGGDDDVPCEEDVANPCGVHVGPWVITLNDFVSDREISYLKDWGANAGYERSQAGDEIIDSRTSSHAWCNEGCYDDPMMVELRERIVAVTGIPEENYECLQLLKYTAGTYYRPHNDYIDKHKEQTHGPRILTFFIYFDEVEEGGSTRFSKLDLPDGLMVEPRRGRVLIWPSVRDDDPYEEDKRTDHEAVPVIRGEKYAANAWIHQRDFQTGFRAGCPS